MKTVSWSIGEIAQRCGVKVSTLHFYEEQNLIQSTRNSANHRRYKPDVLRRVAIIKAAQKMGITLESIRKAFTALPNNRTPSAKDWKKLSTQWRDELNSRIAYLERLRDYMTGCIGCGCLSMKNCPVYNLEDKLAEEGFGAVVLERVMK